MHYTTEMFLQNFPFEDLEARAVMAARGNFVLTEAEPCFDAADAMRFGRDIFMFLSHVSSFSIQHNSFSHKPSAIFLCKQATNRSGVDWLRRHLAPRGINVHSMVHEGLHNCHCDATLIPLSRP